MAAYIVSKATGAAARRRSWRGWRAIKAWRRHQPSAAGGIICGLLKAENTGIGGEENNPSA
jgi:hypothetical protein